MRDHRLLLRGLVAGLLCAALAWSLLRYGATQVWSLYGLFLALLLPAVILCLGLPLRKFVGYRLLALLGIGLLVLAQTALQPTLEGLGYVHLAVGWLTLFLTLSLAVESRRTARSLFVFIALIGLSEAVFGLLHAYGLAEPLARNPEIDPELAIGTLITPTHFAGLTAMTLPVAIAAAFQVAPQGRSRRGRFAARLFGGGLALAVLATMGLAVYRAESRGGALALVAALTLVALLSAVRWRMQVTGKPLSRGVRLSLLCVGTLVMVTGLGLLLTSSGVLSLKNRAEIYRDSLHLIRDHPLLGIGPGMYQWRFRPYQTVNLKNEYVHAHSDYLETTAEWGIPAAILFWSFLIWRLYRAGRLFLVTADRWQRTLGFACSGAICALLTHSLVDFNLQIPGNLVLFAMIVGLAWSLEAGGESASGEPPGETPRGLRSPTVVVIRILLPVLLVAGGWKAVHRLTGLQLSLSNPKIDGLEASLRWDPQSSEVHHRLGLLYRDRLSEQSMARALTHLEKAVELNPHSSSYRWELSKFYELSRRPEEAEAAYLEAVARNPRDGPYRWGFANFYLRSGRLRDSLPQFRLAIAESQYLQGTALRLLLKAGADFETIEQVWPQNRDARLWLLKLVSYRGTALPASWEIDDLLGLWQRLLRDPRPPSVAEGSSFIRWLISQERLEPARQAWIDLSKSHGVTDASFVEKRNYLWNGSFEHPLAGGILGWKPLDKGITLAVAEGPDGSGALRFDFVETGKLNSCRLQQLAIVDPGRTYELSLSARSRGTCDGTRIRVDVRDSKERRALVQSCEMRLSSRWARYSCRFEVPTGRSLIEVRLQCLHGGEAGRRNGDWLWLDSVVLRRLGFRNEIEDRQLLSGL